MRPWLLRSEGRTILVDTGVGNDKSRPAVPAWDHLKLDYLGTLARAGGRPEDVDLVVNTHPHVDHVGRNTRLVDGAWLPTFPNATYLMPPGRLRALEPGAPPRHRRRRQRERLRGQRRPRPRRRPGPAVGGHPHHRPQPAPRGRPGPPAPA
ncbi:MBL fold metallo-hydrolase [Streptomyces chartreusis]